MKKVNTVLFDLDGTLIDSNPIIIKTFEHTLNMFVPEVEFTLEQIKSFLGPSLYQSFGQYRPLEVVEEMIKEYRRYYVENEVGNFEIYPNVLDVVKKLKEEGYYLGIVTTKFKEAAWPEFAYYGLDKYFDAFVGLDHVTEPKPSAEPVKAALSMIPESTGAIMIGDNATDIMAGQNAGVYSAGVAWSIKGVDSLKAVNPDYIIEDMWDVVEIVNELNR